MNNIIVPIDAGNFNMGLIRFAGYIAELTGSTLTGAFLESLDPDAQVLQNPSAYLAYEERDEYVRLLEATGTLTQLEQTVEMVKQACLHMDVEFEVRYYSDQQLIHESRFAKLIIAEPALKSATTGDIPSKIVTGLMAHAECPVILAPGNYSEINNIVHCYDGSKASVYAIKQFTFLFPKLKHLPCTLLKVNDPAKEMTADEDEMQRWLTAHHGETKLEVLEGSTAYNLVGYLQRADVSGSFLTMGAYSRSKLSNLLRESTLNQVLRAVSQPVFVSHP